MDFTGAIAEPIGHLGLIAATIQDTGLMDTVNKQISASEGSVKHGHRVGAMILNGLGFINTALYMTPRFFYDKPLDLLLGKGITAEKLNDNYLSNSITLCYFIRSLLVIRSYGQLLIYLNLNPAVESITTAQKQHKV